MNKNGFLTQKIILLIFKYKIFLYFSRLRTYIKKVQISFLWIINIKNDFNVITANIRKLEKQKLFNYKTPKTTINNKCIRN